MKQKLQNQQASKPRQARNANNQARRSSHANPSNIRYVHTQTESRKSEANNQRAACEIPISNSSIFSETPKREENYP